MTIGFTELNENVNLIINELYYRHDVRSSPSPSSPNNNNNNNQKSSSLIQNLNPVLIVSSHPSPGEAAAVLACTKRHIPFVPLPIHGPHRIGPIRIESIISEVNPAAAMVVLSPPLSIIVSDANGNIHWIGYGWYVTGEFRQGGWCDGSNDALGSKMTIGGVTQRGMMVWEWDRDDGTTVNQTAIWCHTGEDETEWRVGSATDEEWVEIVRLR